MPDQITHIDVDTVVDSYIVCALWSTNADHLDPEGTGSAGALEDHFSTMDIAEESYAQIRTEVHDFIAHAAALLKRSGLSPEQIGHDFWLTRNGHGAGFWDRGLGEVGDRLTAAAEPYGESYLYAGDDGKVYVS